ncbi:hypothetical protein C8F01DRAFT_1151000 [Mycena amicta]|nr:hypothetical protein C8F01DRAFT_1151000 [Mycena amicta]
MLNNAEHHWSQNSQAGPDIKVESLPDFSLLSSPSCPSNPLTSSSSFSSTRRRSHPTSPQRARPYPRSRIEDSEMATTPAYWASPRGNARRGSEGTQQQLVYNHSPYPMYPHTTDSSDEHHRLSPSSGSSGTSSLTGAIGEASMSWSQGTMLPPHSQYSGVPGPSFTEASGSAAYYQRDSPESLSPPSPFSVPEFNNPFPTNYAPTASYPPVPPHDSEVRRLRKRLRDLEQTNHRAIEQIKVLESRLANAQQASPPMSASPPSSAFLASWKARTDARIREFCSLNRAGNALCAWHDSRRERRVHPPRMAPAGYLNCGCTYEEALFEESLTRHHVGSYLPGETVRMDPALRNPLLRLLQQRYAYRDGDFERDPRSGDWLPGEGPAHWEQGSAPNSRRDRR